MGLLLQPVEQFCRAAAAAAPSGLVASACTSVCGLLGHWYALVSDGAVQLSDGDALRLLSTASLALETLPRLLHAAAEEAQGPRWLARSLLVELAPSLQHGLSSSSKLLGSLLEFLGAADPPSRALAAARAGRALSQQALRYWLSTTTAGVAYFCATSGEQQDQPATGCAAQACTVCWWASCMGSARAPCNNCQFGWRPPVCCRAWPGAEGSAAGV